MTPIDTLGDYELLEQIAAGGMAKTFRVRRRGAPESEMLCLKVMHHNLGEDEDFVKMIIDEARIAESLVHPNIVRVFDFGETAGRYYIAMELIEGRDLKQILERSARLGTRMTPAMVAVIVRDICRALHYVHTKRLNGKALNIVHRDISPHNVILNWKGQPKLTDFGIAKAAGRLTHTRTGAVKGKCGYMSPEQARGDEIDARSDVFSVGILMHEMLTGRRLFAADSNFQAFAMILEDPIPPPSMYVNGLDQELELICFKALERAQASRYASAGDMRRDLDDWIARHVGPPQKAGVGEYLGTLFGMRDGALPAAEVPLSEEMAALARLSTNIFDAPTGLHEQAAPSVNAGDLQRLPARLANDSTGVFMPEEDSLPGSSTVQLDKSLLAYGANGVQMDEEDFGSTVQIDHEALSRGAASLAAASAEPGTVTDHQQPQSQGPSITAPRPQPQPSRPTPEPARPAPRTVPLRPAVPATPTPSSRPAATPEPAPVGRPTAPPIRLDDPPPDYSVVGATMTVDGDMIVEEGRVGFPETDDVGTTIEVDFGGIDFSRPPGAGGLSLGSPRNGASSQGRAQPGIQLSPSLEFERIQRNELAAHYDMAEATSQFEARATSGIFGDEEDPTLPAPRLIPDELRAEIERQNAEEEAAEAAAAEAAAAEAASTSAPAPRVPAGIARPQRPPRPAPPTSIPPSPPRRRPPDDAEQDDSAPAPGTSNPLIWRGLMIGILVVMLLGTCTVGIIGVVVLDRLKSNTATPDVAVTEPVATSDAGVEASADTQTPDAPALADKGDDPPGDKGDKEDKEDKPSNVASDDGRDDDPKGGEAGGKAGDKADSDGAIAQKSAEEERQKKLAEERRQRWLKERATFVFSAKPGAKIFIDGKKVGQTPMKKHVKPGTYDIRFNNDELRRARFFNKVTIKAGETKNISYSFQ